MRALQAALAAALAAVAVASGQTTVAPVRFDLVVTDSRGRSVDDLTAADIEITIGDGSPLTPDEVRFVRGGGSADPGHVLPPITTKADEKAEAAREGTRLFGILLDEYHITPGAAAEQARDALVRFVSEHIGPRDLVVVVRPLDSLVNLRATRDREAVLGVIASFQGRKGNLAPRDEFERDFFAGSPGRIEAMRAQIAVSALNALVVHLGGLSDARKSVVMVSEGFARAPRRRGEGLLPTVDGVVRAANRGKVAIYAISPRDADAPASLEPSEVPDGRETLERLAEDTDGHASFTPADFAATLGRVAADSSGFYLITLAGAADGRFHPITVRVKRPATVVRARKGFWAPSAEELVRARSEVRSHGASPLMLVPRRVSPLIRTWFGQSKAGEGRTRVSFAWEPAAGRVLDRARAGGTPARIVFRARDREGAVVHEGVVRPSLVSAPMVAGESGRMTFEAEPGRLLLEMRIEDALMRTIDTDVRDFLVGELSGAVVFGTPEVHRARTAREFRALERDFAAPPAVGRDFSRAERILIRFRAYAADGEPVVTARLRSRLGSAMRDLTALAQEPAGMYHVELPLAGLASGEYAVELTAVSGNATAREIVAFHVGS